MAAARRAPEHGGADAGALRPKTPHSIDVEHQELLEEPRRLAGAPGEAGAAARAVTDIKRHFAKETVLALPPLGLLPSLGQGRAIEEQQDVLSLIGDLRRELPTMLEEHQQIGRALEQLTEAATRMGSAEGRAFAEKLRLHAEMEEEVLYPTALLIGRFLEEHAARPGRPPRRS